MTEPVDKNQDCPCGSLRNYKRCCYLESTTELRSGIPLPSFDYLETVSLHQLDRIGISPHLRSQHINELNYFLHGEPFPQTPAPQQAPGRMLCRVMKQGRADIIFIFPEAHQRPQAKVHFQEQTPGGGLLAACSCSLYHIERQQCQHFKTATFALWSLVRGEEHYNLDLYPLEADFYRMRNRTPRSHPQGDLRLESILFCPFLGADFQFQGGAGSESSPLTSPGLETEPLTAMLLKTYQALTAPEISWAYSDWRVRMEDQSLLKIGYCFHEPGFSFYNTAMCESLEFRFHNGMSLTLKELLHHHLFWSIPKALWPLSRIPATNPQAPAWARVLACSATQPPVIYDFGLLQTFLLRFLTRALALSPETGIPVYLVNSVMRTHPRQRMRLRTLDFSQGDQLDAPWEYVWEPLMQSWTLRQVHPVRAPFQVSAGTLSFFPEQAALEAHKLSEAPLLFKPWGRQQALQEDLSYFHNFLRAFQLKAPSARNEAKTITTTSATPRAGGLQNGPLPLEALPLPTQQAAPDAAQLAIEEEFWLTPEGLLKMSRRLVGANARIWNCFLSDHGALHFRGKPFFHVLELGIAYGGDEVKSIAYSRKGAKRDQEMKLLRHTGFAAALTLETLSYGLEQKNSSGQSFATRKDFLAWLDERLGVLAQPILQLHDSPEVPLGGRKNLHLFSKIFSTQVVQWVFDWVAKLLDALRLELAASPRQTLFLSGVWVSVPQTIVPLAQMVLALLKTAAQLTQGQCFLKARKPAVFQNQVQDSSFWLNDWILEEITPRDSGGTLPEIPRSSSSSSMSEQPGAAIVGLPQGLQSPFLMLHALLDLQSLGYKLFWNGEPVASLQASDLQTIFDVQTAQKKDKGSSALDWFELHPQVFFRGKELSLAELSTASHQGIIAHQGHLYVIPAKNLPSLQRLASFWDRLQSRSSGAKKGSESEANYRRLPSSETLEFLALVEDLKAKTSGLSPEWKEVEEFYLRMDRPRAPLELPSSVQATLKPYQASGVQWLLDLHALRLGGILADDMGLGKTVQALVFLEILRQRGKLGAVLVIVPTSLTWNWMHESGRFTPQLPIQVFEGKHKPQLEESLARAAAPSSSSAPHPSNVSELEAAARGTVLIVTYGLLVEHSEWFLGTAEQPKQWDLVLFDEAQNLKNITSCRSYAARGLVAQAKYCLTGTPLENHIFELYALLDLVVPGCLGDPKTFRNRYENLVEQEDLMPTAGATSADASPQIAAQRAGKPQNKGRAYFPERYQEEIQFLRRKIHPLLLRRTKHAILSELPQKVETRIHLPLETQQRKIYRDIALAFTKQVNESVLKVGEVKSQFMMLTALLRLRQACSEPSCLPQVKYTKIAPKLQFIMETLPSIVEGGESVLIFTQFLTTLERWGKELEKMGMETYSIHGGVTRKDREEILKTFQSPLVGGQGRVLIMTLKTGGVGLNLTAASYVIHAEPWWNPAAENQATDRAHRMGQMRSVQVYRCVMQSTVEEKIELLKAKKSAIFDAVINGASESSEESAEKPPASDPLQPGMRTLSRKDFNLLLSDVS